MQNAPNPSPNRHAKPGRLQVRMQNDGRLVAAGKMEAPRYTGLALTLTLTVILTSPYPSPSP